MIPAGFDPQPTLQGPELKLRPLQADDHAALYAAASDPATWAGHPAKDRYKPDVFQPYFASLLASATTLIVINRMTDTTIGCSRYYTAPDRPGTIAIGFTFLHCAHWGGSTNRALKTLMLNHAFDTFPEVWFHIGPTNIRSQKATAKLGAQFVADRTLDLSGGPALWKVYRLTRSDWKAG